MTTTAAPLQLVMPIFVATCHHCPAPVERVENRRGLRVGRCLACDEAQARMQEREVAAAVEKWTEERNQL